MAEARIPVDVFNPGQVFACLGLLEAADILLGDAEAAFDWPEDRSSCTFVLRAAGSENPLHAVISFLHGAKLQVLLPHGFSGKVKKQYKNVTCFSSAYPLYERDKFSVAPVLLKSKEKSIMISYWDGKDSPKGVTEVKFWAGNYSAADVIDQFLEHVKSYNREQSPFDFSAPISRSFRLDWRRDYVPMDIGFSLNNHNDIHAIGYPLTELLAAIGLNYARPKKIENFLYRYAIIGKANEAALLPSLLIRAALGAADLPFPMRHFQMQLGVPGEHQRCITNVIEETNNDT